MVDFSKNPFVAMFKEDGKWNPLLIIVFVIILVVLSWAFSKLFGKSNYTVTSKKKEGLEIITTDNAIPSTPVSKVPLAALGVLSQNNHRGILKGFDVEGNDSPS